MLNFKGIFTKIRKKKKRNLLVIELAYTVKCIIILMSLEEKVFIDNIEPFFLGKKTFLW